MSQMSWDELRTRVGQEVGKRLDAALASVGVQPRTDLLSATAAPPGKFFFTSEELPERVRLLKQHLPHEVEAIIQEADEICQHRFRLLGYDNLNYGVGKDGAIDWHFDAVHNKRTPLIPWHKINYLDFELAGDHKITWELNRHQHLVTLAKAWALTRDDRYASEAIAQWYSWREANPYPLGVNWASSLELAFRSFSWLWMQYLVAGCAAVPASFADDLQRALALHGRHIERYLSSYFSPNTHLLGEAVALFFIGTLCPQIAAAPRWKQTGWRIIQEEAQRQVRPDGVYFEQSLHYHVYALDFFLHARLLAPRNGVEIPSQLDDVIRRMLTVVQALSQVGPPDGFGDDDGGRVFNPRRNRAEHMTDPLATGAAMFHDEGIHAPPTEESIWLFGRDAIPRAVKSEHRPQSRAFPDGGLYILASADPPQQMVIDAGPQGTGRSGHGHADALSVKLSFNDRPWLVDSGTGVYISPGSERQTFRGTRAHNTLAVDGLDQAQPEGPFAWSDLPQTRVEQWIASETFSFFTGSHTGYERLADPVLHRRFVFHLHGDFWLVRDCVEGKGSHLLETSWHFAPDLELSDCGASFVATPRVEEHGAPALTLLPISDSPWKCNLAPGETSPAYGAKTSAAVVRCSARVNAPAEHAMLLLPSCESAQPPAKFTRVTQASAGQTPAAVYHYDRPEDSHCMIFGTDNRKVWTFGLWASDASFLFARVRDQKLTHLAFCGATVVHLRGESVFSHSSSIQYLEWITHRDGRRVHSSDAGAVSSLTETALQASILEPATSAGQQH